ncbi:antibiotic biosynthesis monooxygenase [uncultured Microbulbifer sp.]|uniref:putative quinol monooxygenase n=1 Tax=uncultured Microbulbifer sp. TaxID=348147 RepID=UPI002633E8D3|nr:antibiotic biosynthesis monooxygenase [uncultured Microbulbifer sp.]
MSKVILEGYLLVSELDLEAVLNELPIHINLTRKESGCLRFIVEQDAVNNNRFNVYEEFSSRETFNEHQDRVRGSKWGQVSSGAERYYQIFETN